MRPVRRTLDSDKIASGTYDALEAGLPFLDVNEWFQAQPGDP